MLWDNMRYNNIHNIGIPEDGESKKGIEKLFEEILAGNFPNLVKKIVIKAQETQRVPIKMNLKRPTHRHILIKVTNIKNI